MGLRCRATVGLHPATFPFQIPYEIPHFRFFIAASGLTTLTILMPLVGVAQTMSTTPVATVAPRFFVGVGGSFGGYPVPGQSGVNVRSFVPTVGIQLQPRLAVQVSGAYTPDHQSTTYEYDPSYPYYATTERSTRTRTLVIPVLARYTLTRKLAHRFQADVLGGFSFVHFHHAQRCVPARDQPNVLTAHPGKRQHQQRLPDAGGRGALRSLPVAGNHGRSRAQPANNQPNRRPVLGQSELSGGATLPLRPP